MLERQQVPQPWASAWWQAGVFYQLIIRSFQDSDGDGNGDLNGLVERLDYLQWLGADVLWLSPFYPSPLVESGYDVSDFTGVHPLFGTLEIFDRLLAAAHQRGMRIIIDFVPNHTSDQHPWFVESRSNRQNPRRDWYVWADPAPDGGPPNNWVSVFGGSSWTLDPATNQYYYHSFMAEQPDLNWHNPAVHGAVFDAMRFWLERGVDGFRMDAIWHLFQDHQLRDNPANPDYHGRTADDPPDAQVIPRFTRDRPEMHTLLAEMRRLVDGYPDRLLAGELYLPVERLVTYYGLEAPELQLPFNLLLGQTPWTVSDIARFVNDYMTALPQGAWPSWTIGTHDYARVVTRIGPAQARVAALLLLTLPGTPTIFYGDEIGMANVQLPPDQIEDPQHTAWPGHGRDPARTPMQWEDSPGAGFTTGKPWKQIGANLATVNVATQRDDPYSLLSLYRRLIALRRQEAVLVGGAYLAVSQEEPIFAYRRSGGQRQFIVVLNMGARPHSFTGIDEGHFGRIVLSSYLDRDGEPVEGELRLRSDEGVVLELTQE